MLRTVFVWLALLVGINAAQAMDWNGLFLAGDDSIDVFDNSQRDLIAVLTERGLDDTTRFTASRRIAKANPDIALITDPRIEDMPNLHIAGEGEGCLVHFTSHGVQGEGFYLSLNGGTILDPRYMALLLDQVCGGSERQVVLVSACYSGQFITRAIKAPNRIILTAARANRPSFGCSAEETYTYWDGCLIEELPRAKTWGRLYDSVSVCITEKEAAIGAEPSEPQAWFGDGGEGWRIMN